MYSALPVNNGDTISPLTTLCHPSKLPLTSRTLLLKIHRDEDRLDFEPEK